MKINKLIKIVKWFISGVFKHGVKEMMRLIRYNKMNSPESQAMGKKMAKEFEAGLKCVGKDSVERNERWERIYAVERTKWPHNMGSKMRDEIPEELYPELDECITESQKIARDACQTVELTEAYLKNSTKQK